MKYRKKPVVIEAIQLNHKNLEKLWNWMYGAYLGHGTAGDDQFLTMQIETPEGVMLASHGDWIIKGVAGEFYPCKPDIFEKLHEAVIE